MMRKILFIIIIIVMMHATLLQAFTVSAEEKVTRHNSDTLVIRFMGSINDHNVRQLMQAIEKEMYKNAIKTIKILILSDGGSVGSGVAAYNYLSSLSGLVNIKTHNMSFVASAANYLYCAGKERSSSPIAQFLIHQPTFNMNSGSLSLDKLRETSEMAKLNYDMAEQIITSCTSKSVSEVKKLHNAGETLTPQQAKNWGFVHKIEDISLAEADIIYDIPQDRDNVNVIYPNQYY